LALNVNSPEHAESALKTFDGAAYQLIPLATGGAMPPDPMRMAMLAGRGGEWSVDGAKLTVTREPYGPEGLPGGYTMRLLIDVE
jgi:hypothetical protein